MNLPARWVLATSNRGKLDELSALFAESGLGLTLIAQTELGVPSPEETGATFVENALLKARHAALLTGLPAIADDSGLVVPALGGAPGVRSARFAGAAANDAANVAKLLAVLGAGTLDRRARFHCVLVALLGPEDPAPIIASGEWLGEIAPRPSGNHGFGYDPVFFDPSLGKLAAELEPAVKNRVSHRGRALRELAELLKKR